MMLWSEKIQGISVKIFCLFKLRLEVWLANIGILKLLSKTGAFQLA